MAKAVEEEKMLEESLTKALDEAWAKVNQAVKDAKAGREDAEKKIWLAAEATEYCSLLFSITYGLEDWDPAPESTKNMARLALVRESAVALQRVRTSRDRPREAYQLLRNAVNYLRTAYLGSRDKHSSRTSL